MIRRFVLFRFEVFGVIHFCVLLRFSIFVSFRFRENFLNTSSSSSSSSSGVVVEVVVAVAVAVAVVVVVAAVVCRGSPRGARSRGSRGSRGSRASAGRAGRAGHGASADKNNKTRNSPSRSRPVQTHTRRK